MIHPHQNYNSFRAITLSNTDLVVCDALYIGGAGTLLLSPDDVTAPTTFTCVAGQVLPVALRNGRIMLTGTATGIIALQ